MARTEKGVSSETGSGSGPPLPSGVTAALGALSVASIVISIAVAPGWLAGAALGAVLAIAVLHRYVWQWRPPWWALATVLLIAIAGMGGGRLLSEALESGPEAVTASDGARGAGREAITGHGVIEGEPFTPRAALVAVADTGVELRIYGAHYDCGSVLEAYSDDAAWFEVGVAESARGVAAVPVGRPLPEPELSNFGVVVQRPGNLVESYSDFGGHITFTRIDTSPGGVWHGVVDVPRIRTSRGVAWFEGTFAAEWCGG